MSLFGSNFSDRLRGRSDDIRQARLNAERQAKDEAKNEARRQKVEEAKAEQQWRQDEKTFNSLGVESLIREWSKAAVRAHGDPPSYSYTETGDIPGGGQTKEIRLPSFHKSNKSSGVYIGAIAGTTSEWYSLDGDERGRGRSQGYRQVSSHGVSAHYQPHNGNLTINGVTKHVSAWDRSEIQDLLFDSL